MGEAVIIYGKSKTYPLAHLLEYGHLTRNGKRRTKAIVHIAPVEEWAVKESTEKVISFPPRFSISPAQTAVMILESRPPERNVPIGTSETI